MDEQTNIGQAAPPFLHQALDRAEADIAAGRVKPWLSVRDRLLNRVDAMEAAGRQRKA